MANYQMLDITAKLLFKGIIYLLDPEKYYNNLCNSTCLCSHAHTLVFFNTNTVVMAAYDYVEVIMPLSMSSVCSIYYSKLPRIRRCLLASPELFNYHATNAIYNYRLLLNTIVYLSVPQGKQFIQRLYLPVINDFPVL